MGLTFLLGCVILFLSKNDQKLKKGGERGAVLL